MATERKDGPEETEGSIDGAESCPASTVTGDMRRELRDRYLFAYSLDSRGKGHTKPEPFMTFDEWSRGARIY